MASGLENIETIESPFRRFVTTIGVFPTAFTDAMTYYECLAYLVKYLEDTVVPAVNENAEALTELQKYYVQLKSYVDNYFDNLDVQEEINNKLDEMAEAGTLQEIITTYIQSNVTWTFDTVADMKQATNLVDGSYARTLGFYSVNDGGGATYYITNTGTANEMDVIAIGSLFANLQHKDTVYIKQLGAKDDGETDVTNIFVRAFTIADNVIVNKTATSYLTKYIKVLDGKSLVGESLPYVQIDITRGSSAVVPDAGDNCAIDKIYFNATDADLNNNRFDVRGSDVTITNSRFDGFRASSLNAWGILLTGAKKVLIKDCYFDNNTQSDIALVEGCENVTIQGCKGTSFHINVEPQSQPKMYNIKFDQCNIAKLDLRENQAVYDTCISFTVTNCTIDLLEYDGANTTFIDCVIKDIQQQNANGGGGQVKFINSLNMGKNLIDDVYLDSFNPASNTSDEWHGLSTPIGWQDAVSMAKLNNEPVLTIHPSKDVKRTITIGHQPISVSTNKIYMLRIGASADYTPAATSNISRSVLIRCLDSSNNQLTELSPSMFRGAQGSVVPMHEETWFFKVPSNTSYIVLMFRNANYGAQSLSIRSCELYEVASSEIVKNEVATPAVRHNRVYHGNAVYTNINNNAGDIMFYKTPTAGGNIGQVCTTGGYPATWKAFGSIAS